MKHQRTRSRVCGSRAYLHWLGSALIVLALAHQSTSQAVNPLNKPTSPANINPAPVIVDPLGRSTPRGTITAFIRAVHRSDFVSAARYMQLTPKQRQNVDVLALDLKELMDRYFSRPITSISESPAGDLDDGLPLDQERVGPLTVGNGNVYILLVRVNDPENGQIWLISSETLEQVPAWYDAIEMTWVEREMPAPLLEYNFLGIPVVKWVAWIISIGLPLLLFWALTQIAVWLLKLVIRDSPKYKFVVASFIASRWPLTMSLALGVHLLSLRYFGFSLNFRIIYSRIGLVVFVIVVTWFILRTSTLAFGRTRSLLEHRRSSSTESLILLGERVFKVVIILAAALLVLTIAGVDTKTALAGVGIGGVAVALGAQKSVENLLGGVFLLSDKTLAVGDMCCISDRYGWVEDITLRSIRLRTLEQTLLSVPAGILSQANIENFATRRKILAQTNVLLRYGTTVEQLRIVLNGIRELLDTNVKVERQTARIRLINFGPRAIELELYVYFLTADNMEFLAARENLLLQIAGIVEAAGTAFAQPTEYVYLGSQQETMSASHDLEPRNESQSYKKQDGLKTGLGAMKERAS